MFIFRGEMRHGLYWTNGWTDKWLDGQMQKRPKSQNPEYSKSREGVIIKWPLKWKYNDAVIDALASLTSVKEMVVIRNVNVIILFREDLYDNGTRTVYKWWWQWRFSWFISITSMTMTFKGHQNMITKFQMSRRDW